MRFRIGCEDSEYVHLEAIGAFPKTARGALAASIQKWEVLTDGYCFNTPVSDYEDLIDDDESSWRRALKLAKKEVAFLKRIKV